MFVFTGGMKRIAKVTELIVPIMAAFYIVGSLIVIFANVTAIPAAFHDIIVGAFKPAAVAGGAMGATLKLAVQKGVARGLFSNEAGMGSTPHAHAVAKVNHPVEQGFVAMIGVFIDTFVILNLTALVIITTGSRTTGFTGAQLSQYAFSTLYGKFGEIFIAILYVCLRILNDLGWYFFVEQHPLPVWSKSLLKFTQHCMYLRSTWSLQEVDLVWNMADCFNSMMVIPECDCTGSTQWPC